MKRQRITWLLALAAGGLGGAAAAAQENVVAPAEIELPDGSAAAQDASAGADGAENAEVPVVPWTGTYAEGMAEVVRLAANAEHDAAFDLTERLLAPDGYARLRARLEEKLGPRGAALLGPLDAPLAWIGLETLDDRSRAEVRYVRGLLRARAGAVLRADEELGLARALAGPGTTRNDAVYALGTLDLALAEELRQRIPEISGAQPTAPTNAPPLGTAPGAGASGSEKEPDPLELARAAYLEAREHLVERLRFDWRDANTRANTELVQRRLRELDEIERQREEEQEENSQQSPQEQPENEDSEQQESEDQESQDQDSEDQESESQESESEEDSESEESEESEDAESEEEAEDAEQESEAELEERVLTQEEMMRLLQEFQRYQEQGEEMREQNRRVRRENVDKDW